MIKLPIFRINEKGELETYDVRKAEFISGVWHFVVGDVDGNPIYLAEYDGWYLTKEGAFDHASAEITKEILSFNEQAKRAKEKAAELEKVKKELLRYERQILGD